jgi:hypothetical protein
LRAIEDLTDLGTDAFRASAVARRVGSAVATVTPCLIEMVNDGRLRLRFDLLCPDNGRTIRSYREKEDLPIGEEVLSDRCGDDEPFVVEPQHIWVQFVPTEEFRARVRRERAPREKSGNAPEDDPPGLRRPSEDSVSAYLRRGDLTQVHNYYAPVTNLGDENVIGDENVVAKEGSQAATSGGVAAGGDVSDVETTGGADARGGGTAATGGSAVGQKGSDAAAGGSQTNVGVVERAKKSTQFKVFAVIAVIITVISTVFVVTGVWDIAWAGYVLAALGVVVAVLPLRRGG